MNDEITAYRTLLPPGRPNGERTAPPVDEPRGSNLSGTLALLHLHGQQSRSELVATLGLSRSTVGSLIAELVEHGVAEEAGVDRQPSPGRPSQVVQLVGDKHVALAIEIGPGHLSTAVVALGGRVLSSRRRALRAPAGDFRLIAEVLAEMVDEQASSMRDAALMGTGIAVAGLVSADGILQHAPNLGWTATDVRNALAEALPADAPVSVGNESTLAAVGEYLRGSLRGVANGLIVTGDIGVGGGAIINGRLLRGADAMAGEIGHMGVAGGGARRGAAPDGRPCRCGAAGCWETVIGLEAIQRHCGMTDLPDGSDPVTAILAAAEAGDEDALAGLETTGRWLGWGLATLVNVLNPERIVIGGRLGQLLPLLTRSTMAELERSALGAMARDCEVVTPALGKEAALIGASEHVFWNAINNLEVLRAPKPVAVGSNDKE